MASVAQIFTKINSWIVSNATKAITAIKLQEVLLDITKSTFLAYPASVELTDSDIGKLVMNTGSEVVVARRNKVVASQQGHWIITFTDHFPVPQAASVWVNFTGVVNNGDTFTIFGRAFRFVPTPLKPFDIQIEADQETQAITFQAKMNSVFWGQQLNAGIQDLTNVQLVFDGQAQPWALDITDKGQFIGNIDFNALININSDSIGLSNYQAGVLNAMEYDYSGGYQFTYGAISVPAQDIIQNNGTNVGQLMWNRVFPLTPEQMAFNFAFAVNSQGSDFTATVIGAGDQVEIFANIQPGKPNESDIVINDNYMVQASIETIAYNVAETEIALPYPVLGQLQGFIVEGSVRKALIKDTGMLRVKLNGTIDAIASVNPLATSPIPSQLYMGYAVVNEGGVEVLASSAPASSDDSQMLEIFKNIYVIKSNAEVGQDVLVQKLDGFDLLMGFQLLGG